MTENIIEIRGKGPGPISMILVGVHGDEKCGPEALGRLLPSLSIERGLLLIAYGNPEAIGQNKRFVEENLNRMFKPEDQLSEKEKKSYEYKRAQFLKESFDQAEVLLDIHASFTPGSQRFAICEPVAWPLVKHLPVDLAVSGFDSVEPGGTDYYMNSHGKIGICLECGYLDDDYSTTVAMEGIKDFLAIRGHIISESPEERAQKHVEIKKLYLSKTDRFVLARSFQDFEEIRRGELISHDGEEEIRADYDGVILFARNVGSPGEEAFLFGVYRKA